MFEEDFEIGDLAWHKTSLSKCSSGYRVAIILSKPKQKFTGRWTDVLVEGKIGQIFTRYLEKNPAY